ncbi:MAG: hypothetical protein R3332_09185 [Pseudohongiellaceae bacterium]|nr:hypothetical protein [Pseudohongiellaceae bacterium]
MEIRSYKPKPLLLIALVMICWLGPAQAQEGIGRQLSGTWLINEELSEDPDKAVEEAIIEAGGKVKRNWFGRQEKERYRGGPKEHELYDRLTYDDVLRIRYEQPEFWFGYEDGFQRVFHTDGRTRQVEASEVYENGAQDFSFGAWENDTLYVEARPRDGGFTLEAYRLLNGGDRLEVQLTIRPKNFGAAIELTRIYDKQ